MAGGWAKTVGATCGCHMGPEAGGNRADGAACRAERWQSPHARGAGKVSREAQRSPGSQGVSEREGGREKAGRRLGRDGGLGSEDPGPKQRRGHAVAVGAAVRRDGQAKP